MPPFRQLVNGMLPKVDFPELLLEVAELTGMPEAFTHISGSDSGMEGFTTSLRAVLLSEACNVGMTPVIKPDVPALTTGRLAQVDQGVPRTSRRRTACSSPVPAPTAALLLEYVGNRDNMNTATNPASPWPFPGRRAGQPARPDHLSALLNEVGVLAAAARGAAIRQQLLELPGPVVADALGYHDKTTIRLIREAGGTWSRYAAGGHTRPTGWVPRRTATVEWAPVS